MIRQSFLNCFLFFFIFNNSLFFIFSLPACSLKLKLPPMESSSQSSPLKMFFIPFLAPGHMIPLTDLAKFFAAHGQHVTIITTPSNAANLRKKAAGHPISFHVVHFPSKEFGLPDGLDNFFFAHDMETVTKLYKAVSSLRKSIEEFINSNPPDCIVSDAFYPWTTQTAASLGIPRIIFSGNCFFTLCVEEALRRPDSPHLRVESDHDSFLIPNLPNPITMKLSELPHFFRTHPEFNQEKDQWREAELNSYGILANTFYELEQDYIEHYKRVKGAQCKVFTAGPVALLERINGGQDNDKSSERDYQSILHDHQCITWLNSKKPDSVLYVCFGSGGKFSNMQLIEIASALEASGHDFIWVVLGKDEEEYNSDDQRKWLPEGFFERMKDKGLIVKGWAPQVLILGHPSVGGFLTHCGLNSVLESLSFGVPMVTWPFSADHFYDEKLVTQVLGIGVEVGAEHWTLWVQSTDHKVIKSDKIETAIRKLMDGGDEAEEMRRKAREIGKKARQAVEPGGSSHTSLAMLIQELKILRDCKMDSA